MNYSEFASTITFFEFIFNEFYPPNFKTQDYTCELTLLKEKITIDRLSELLKSNPKIFDIAEQFFQMKCFTPTHYIHFLFDVIKLNSYDLDTIKNYIDKEVLSFSDGTDNTYFQQFKQKNENLNDTDWLLSIKQTLVRYVDSITSKKDRTDLMEHIRKCIGTRYRISQYLISNLCFDKYSEKIDIEIFLQFKRIPKDAKSIHGKYGVKKIEDILRKHEIPYAAELHKQDIIRINEKNCNISGLSYISEAKISNVVKRKDKKLKKLDFVIFEDGIPILAIETNFYTTSGTKIGINIGEYTDLKEDIDNLAQNSNHLLKFCWITDGNLWLTKTGESTYNNIKSQFFKEKYDLLTFTLFDKMLHDKINQNK